MAAPATGLPILIYAHAVLMGLVYVIAYLNAAQDAFLGPLADDLASFGLDRHLAHRVVEARPACNWKLVIDAFTEGYHVRSLHRQSIARFFLETGAVFDALGPHSRTLGARREVAALRERPEAEWDVREAATVFYIETQVFQQEDLAMAETIQTGLGAGADTHFRVGRLEHTLLLFHRALDRAIADAPP